MQVIAQTILQIASDVLGAPLAEETVMTDVPEWDSLKTLQIVMAPSSAAVTSRHSVVVCAASSRPATRLA